VAVARPLFFLGGDFKKKRKKENRAQKARPIFAAVDVIIGFGNQKLLNRGLDP